VLASTFKKLNMKGLLEKFFMDTNAALLTAVLDAVQINSTFIFLQYQNIFPNIFFRELSSLVSTTLR